MKKRFGQVTALLMTAVLLVSCLCVNFSIAVEAAAADGFIADFEDCELNGKIPDGITRGGDIPPELKCIADPRNPHDRALEATVPKGYNLISNLWFSYTRSERFDGISFWIKSSTTITIDVRVRIGEQTIYSLGRVTLGANQGQTVTALYANAKTASSLNASVGTPVTFEPEVGAQMRFAVHVLGGYSAKQYVIDDVCQYSSNGGTADTDYTVAYQDSDHIRHYTETVAGSMLQDFETDSDLTFMTLTGADSQNNSITANTTVVNTGSRSAKVMLSQVNHQDGVLTFTYNKAAQWNSLAFWMASGQTVVLNVKVTVGNATPLRILRQTVEAEDSGVILATFPDSLKTYAGSVKVEIFVSSHTATAVMWLDSMMQTNVAKPAVSDMPETGNIADDVSVPANNHIVTDFEAYANNAALYAEWDYVTQRDWLTGTLSLDRGNQYRGYNSLRLDYDFSRTGNPLKQKFSVQGPLATVNQYGIGFYLHSSEEVIVDVMLLDEAGHFVTLRLPANEYDEWVFVNFGSIVAGNSTFGRLNRDSLSLRLTVMPSNNALVGTVYVDDIGYSDVAVNPECETAHVFANTCDTSCNRCGYTRPVTHTPDPDDGNCETDTLCSICRKTLTSGLDNHVFTNSCDAVCNNCTYTRDAYHIPDHDDGDCTTAVNCSICGEVTTEAADHHVFLNDCDPTCDNCEYTRQTEHIPNQDDGDCTTAICCSICGEVMIAGEDSHVYDNDCDFSCANCEYIREIDHDDHDCTVADEINSKLLFGFEGTTDIPAGVSKQYGDTIRGKYAIKTAWKKSGEQSLQVHGITAGKTGAYQEIRFDYTHTDGYNGVSFCLFAAYKVVSMKMYLRNLETGSSVIAFDAFSMVASEEKEITISYSDCGFIPSQTPSKNRLVIEFELNTARTTYFYVDDICEFKKNNNDDALLNDAAFIDNFESGEINTDTVVPSATGACIPELEIVKDPRDDNGSALKAVVPSYTDANKPQSYLDFKFTHSSDYQGLSFWMQAETALTFEIRLYRRSSESGQEIFQYTLKRVDLAAGESRNISAFYADFTGNNSLNATKTYSYVDPADVAYVNQDVVMRLYVHGKSSGTKSYIIDDVKQFNPSFSGASLSLSDDIALNYKVKPDDVAGHTASVEFQLGNDDPITVTNYTQQNDRYVYRFDKIDPSQMTDTITAILKLNDNANPGEEIVVATKTYSVAEYCYNMMRKNPDNGNLCCLLADILEYGAKAQMYVGNNTENLATAELSDLYQKWISRQPQPLEGVTTLINPTEGVTAPTASWKATGLYLDHSVNIRLTFETTEDISGMTAQVLSDTGDSSTIAATEFKSLGNNRYAFLITSLTAAQLRDVVHVVLYSGDTAISNTISYSVETFAASKISGNNVALAELMKALMKYGDSLKRYVD